MGHALARTAAAAILIIAALAAPRAGAQPGDATAEVAAALTAVCD